MIKKSIIFSLLLGMNCVIPQEGPKQVTTKDGLHSMVDKMVENRKDQKSNHSMIDKLVEAHKEDPKIIDKYVSAVFLGTFGIIAFFALMEKWERS